MANPAANDTSLDPDLNAHFSHLSMSSHTDGTAQVDNTASNWASQDPSFLYQAAGTDFPTPPSLHNTDPILAAQTNIQPHSFDYGQYADDTANQAYWQTDAAQAGPSSIPTATDKPFVCPEDGCPKAYRRQCDLDKHYHNHIKYRQCDFCEDGGGAETKDLNRHMWAHHPDEARELNIPKDEARCLRCSYSGRSDNVKRHKDKRGHW